MLKNKTFANLLANEKLPPFHHLLHLHHHYHAEMLLVWCGVMKTVREALKWGVGN
jgi:hypothetical protein